MDSDVLNITYCNRSLLTQSNLSRHVQRCNAYEYKTCNFLFLLRQRFMGCKKNIIIFIKHEMKIKITVNEIWCINFRWKSVTFHPEKVETLNQFRINFSTKMFPISSLLSEEQLFKPCRFTGSKFHSAW